MAAPDAQHTGEFSTAYKIYVLCILIVVYTLNFIDRLIIGILAPPIQAELDLNDQLFGLLGGTTFALFYTVLGIPVARLADRYNRTWIMTIALAMWSGFTALCGLAQNFWHLFFARMGVGVGEAGGTAPAYALVADYFPPEQRARALAAYSFGVPIGSALGIILGGIIASLIDWRAAFLFVGIAGVLLAPVFRMTVREPKRGQYDIIDPDAPHPSIGEVLRLLAAKPSFWGLSLGAASSSIMGYGVFLWMPSFFIRTYDMSLFDVSLFYGAIVFIGGMMGIWLGGTLGDRFGAGNKAAYALVPMASLLVSVPFYVLGVLSPSLVASFFLFLIPTALGLVWIGPVTAAVQHLVKPTMRATASAIFLFINNLIGLGLGGLLLGTISDALKDQFGDESLRYAILSGTGFYVLSAAIFYLSARRLARDWEG